MLTTTAPKQIKQYLFETIERISRFFMHLEDLNKQFYSSEKRILKDKTSFISSYEECLEKLIEVIAYLNLRYKGKLTTNQTEAIFHRLEEINLAIKKLQNELLVHLPRPTEPIELRRFCRVIRKQIVKLKEDVKGEISIYINENTQDSTYASDPLEYFKQEEINSLISSLEGFSKKKKNFVGIEKMKAASGDYKNKIQNIHITIPRLDANNPCHWPILIHEVSHCLMKDEWFNNKSIHGDFINFLKENNINGGIEEIISKINLKSWLIECWCDLFACALIGPSFYFSQYHAFVHSLEYNKNEKYPPNYFRLKLIARFIDHRFNNLYSDESFAEFMEECDELIKRIDPKNNNFSLGDNSEIATLFTLFNQYFLHEFFILENGLLNFKHKELNTLFDSISEFVNKFDLEKINSLSSSLSCGFPIPSFREKAKNNLLHEKPCSVQEIFIASWIYRNGSFLDKILIEFNTFTDNIRKNKKFNLKEQYKQKIVNEFFVFDQSILRSIQISEWVDMLVEKEKKDMFDNISKLSSNEVSSDNRHEGLLIDKKIYKSLLDNEIKIIPLINVRRQLGATSLDIRLGTSFEVFFPNQFGTVDFTEKDTIHYIKTNSKKINLDFLGNIPINPGQFMLGHSMEYIKLPDNIAADLEGRSSFARLGIEIHMTAGFVDPGFEGVLTFEIFNAGTNPIMLYPGLRIGQLRFMKIDTPTIGYARRHSAKYSGSLEHHFSLLGRDYEMKKITEMREHLSLKNGRKR